MEHLGRNQYLSCNVLPLTAPCQDADVLEGGTKIPCMEHVGRKNKYISWNITLADDCSLPGCGFTGRRDKNSVQGTLGGRKNTFLGTYDR